MAGLLYGLLTFSDKREEFFGYVSLVTRDSYQLFIEITENVFFRNDSKKNYSFFMTYLNNFRTKQKIIFYGYLKNFREFLILHQNSLTLSPWL